MFTDIYWAQQAGQVLHQRWLEEAEQGRRGWLTTFLNRNK